MSRVISRRSSNRASDSDSDGDAAEFKQMKSFSAPKAAGRNFNDDNKSDDSDDSTGRRIKTRDSLNRNGNPLRDSKERDNVAPVIRRRMSGPTSAANRRDSSEGPTNFVPRASWDESEKGPLSFIPKEVPKDGSERRFSGQNKNNTWAVAGAGRPTRSSHNNNTDEEAYRSGDGKENGAYTESSRSKPPTGRSSNWRMSGSKVPDSAAPPRNNQRLQEDNDIIEELDDEKADSPTVRMDEDDDDDVISKPKVPIYNKTDSFADYANEVEKSGVHLPRRSGRYSDNEEYNSSDSRGRGQSRSSGQQESKSSASLPRPVSLLPSQAATPASLASSSKSFVLVAHAHGSRTDQVQCVIVRDRTSMSGKLYPAYTLVLEETQKPLLHAKKMNMNRTSNYHLFDLTRGQVGSKLTKKSGNYLGKLRSRNAQRTEYCLVGQNAEKEQFGGILFDRLSFIAQLKEGSQPRKMSIVVPELAADSTPMAHRIYDEETDGMSEMLKQSDLSLLKGVHVFESKEPVFENGNYRLNFHGRVSVPSVKNFQLVSPNDIDDIICQFGKIGDDKFHLDFKAPLNAFQAFSLALCQFNL